MLLDGAIFKGQRRVADSESGGPAVFRFVVSC